jgi:hypothetical protein
MKCPSCGAENRATARFCKVCSEPLAEEQPEIGAGTLCLKCGSPLQPNTRFCGNCGAPIAGGTAQIDSKPAPSSVPQSAPTVKTPRPPSLPTQPTPAPPSPPTVKTPRRPRWSTPPTVKTPPPPAPWPAPQPPPKRRRGISGCGWVLIVGGVLAGLVLVVAVVFGIIWYTTGWTPWQLPWQIPWLSPAPTAAPPLPPAIPQGCGMSKETATYGPVSVGVVVILGRHRPVNGDEGWDAQMDAYVGKQATVTELVGVDPAGCPVVKVDVDGGAWYWRVRDLSLP